VLIEALKTILHVAKYDNNVPDIYISTCVYSILPPVMYTSIRHLYI